MLQFCELFECASYEEYQWYLEELRPLDFLLVSAEDDVAWSFRIHHNEAVPIDMPSRLTPLFDVIAHGQILFKSQRVFTLIWAWVPPTGSRPDYIDGGAVVIRRGRRRQIQLADWLSHEESSIADDWWDEPEEEPF